MSGLKNGFPAQTVGEDMGGSGAGGGGRGCQTWVLAREGYCVQNGSCEDQFQEKYV